MQANTRKFTGYALVALVVSALGWSALQPLPFAIVEPGPAFNVLASNHGSPIIQSSVSVKKDPEGRLDLLTVSLWGSPTHTPNFLQLVGAYFSNDQVVYPLEVFYPQGQNPSDVTAAQKKMFSDSEKASVSAALSKLGLSENPPTIHVNLGEVGGPSGGMMFTLGVIAKLTPGSLTGGKNIAGTGTIDAAGHVGKIGEIRLKMLSAKRAGDKFFLMPVGNCAEALNHVPAGLTVYAVGNLAEALKAVREIATDQSSLGVKGCVSK